jgi:CO/xanthine dehydrogenase Mo-binding subunit
MAPAIVNAIHDALGIRMRDLPVTPEKILRALDELPQEHANLNNKRHI